MDHRKAVEMHATERYLLGELSEGECAEFEEHFFECSECAEDVRAADALIEGARTSSREAPSPAEGVAPAPLAARVLPLPGGARRLRAWFWPMPAGVAAALLVTLSGFFWQTLVALPAAQRELALSRAPQPVAWAFLQVSRSDDEQVVDVARNARLLVLRLSGRGSFPRYRLRLSGPGPTGRVRDVPGPGVDRELEIGLTLGELPAGRYVLEVEGLTAEAGRANPPAVTRYPFSLRFRGE